MDFLLESFQIADSCIKNRTSISQSKKMMRCVPLFNREVNKIHLNKTLHMLFDDDNLRGQRNEHVILLLDSVLMYIKLTLEKELFKSVNFRTFNIFLSFAYHEFDFALKSPRTNHIYWFIFQLYDQNLILNSL